MQPLHFAAADAASRPLHLVEPNGLDAWRAGQPEIVGNWLRSAGFAAAQGELCLLPDAGGQCVGAVFGLGRREMQARTRFAVASAAAALPAGAWHLEGEIAPDQAEEAALGWLLSGYAYRRYLPAEAGPRALLRPPAAVDAARIEAIAAGEALTRDLINTPASDMGPAELEAAARAVAERHGAEMSVVAGAALLEAGLPLIHAVGRASTRAPRLIELSHGDAGPRLTLIGKGVCFDTGGLNLKSGNSMGLMKKDMGGAAAVLGLADTILRTGLPVRLRVLIPAVENAVGGDAFRPGDVLTSRRGLTVEVNNTDAEGRLVLADAIALADEDRPDLMVTMATLTGAARVALGPDVAPFFTDATDLARALDVAAARVRDPVWRLPFHAPYEAMIEPAIADLDNAPKGGFAGSITAALFLRRFVENAHRYLHFDIYGWQPTAATARPRGGVGQGARALFEALPHLFDLG